jgi:hypothetical protein
MQNIRDYEKKKMSLFKIIKEIYSERGINGFYAGFKINLMRILPNTAIMFVAYEYLSKLLNKKLHNLKLL